MRKLTEFYQKSEFFKNVLKLTSSSVFASIITFAALPVITRLYSKEDLGNFQILFSIIMIFGVVASLKYEMAIILPKDDDDARHLTIGSVLSVCFVSLMAALGFFLFDDFLFGLFDAVQLKGFSLFIGAGIFFTGLLQIVRYMLLRKKMFGELATNKIYQAASTQGVSIFWGFLQPNFSGLFAGFLIGTVIPIWLVWRKKIYHFNEISFSKLKKLLVYYRKFPLVNTSMVFLNNFSLELPVFMLSKFYGADVVGLYMLANRLSVIPISLVGTSVSQVYFQAASEAFNTNPSELNKIYQKTIRKLSLIGLIPTAAIFFLAPLLVGFIYGAEWTSAGVYMKIIIIGIYFRFVNSPISTTFSIIDRQELGLVLVAISVIIRFVAMYIFRDTAEQILWALSISSAIFYAVFNYFIYLAIKKQEIRP
ncbi:MAG: oligosaccharide flippase family protein [Calditrichaeota bacterium]|nr:oligosaccharide flippase family protein [Calditrichota bacterium]MCB0266738.1 oligosaccharide flippase family protein [Calditrichota bacterium]MCB0286427.1 oligosaccharide flippase family protein [Calditrichota bacterium]